MAAATCVYRCRKCREIVFDSRCIVTVHGQQNSGGSSVFCQDVSMETVWYVTADSAPEWILDNIETALWTKGKLLCPKCGGRLGSFDFTKTVKCVSGQSTVPPIHIQQCRVDEVSIATQNTLRGRQSKILAKNRSVDPNTEAEKNRCKSDNTEELVSLDISIPFDSTKGTVKTSSHVTVDLDLTSTCDDDRVSFLSRSMVTGVRSFDGVNVDTLAQGGEGLLGETDREKGRPSVIDGNCSSRFTSETTKSFVGKESPGQNTPESDVHLKFVKDQSNGNSKGIKKGIKEKCLKGDNPQQAGNLQPPSKDMRMLSDEGESTNTGDYSVLGPTLNALRVYQSHEDDSQDGHPSNAERSERLTPSPLDLRGGDPVTLTQRDLLGGEQVTQTPRDLLGGDQVTLTQRDLLGGEQVTQTPRDLLGSEQVTQMPRDLLGGDLTQTPGDLLGGEQVTPIPRYLLGSEHRHASTRSKQRNVGRRRKTKVVISPADDDQNDIDLIYPEEHTCPVCLDLYCYPMRTSPCDHIFCDTCLRRLARATPVNTPCPLCRHVISKCHGEEDLARDLKTLYSVLYKKRQVMENKFHRNSYHRLPQLNPARLPIMERLGQDPWQPLHGERNQYTRMGVNVASARYVVYSVMFMVVMLCHTVYRFAVELASLPLTMALALVVLVFITLMAVSGLYVIYQVVRVVGSVSQVVGQAIVQFVGSVFLSPDVEAFQSESSQSLLPTSVRLRAMTANFFIVVIVVLVCRYVFFRRVMVQLGRNG